MRQTGARRASRLPAVIAAIGAAALSRGVLAVPPDPGSDPPLRLSGTLGEAAGGERIAAVSLPDDVPGLLRPDRAIFLGRQPDRIVGDGVAIVDARTYRAWPAASAYFLAEPREESPASTAVGGASGEPSGRAPIVLAQADTRASPASRAAAAAARVPAPAADTPAAQGDTGGAGFQFRLGPIRWGGELADFYSWGQSETVRISSHTQSANIRGASYVWQPWFARVSASLGFATTGSVAQTQSGSNGENQNRSNSITGGGALSLFPLSRFPFSATYDVGDTRSSGELTSVAQRTHRLGLRQSYTPAQSRLNIDGSFNRSTIESETFGRDTVNTLRGALAYPIGEEHRLNFDTEFSNNKRDQGGDGTSFLTMMGRHSFLPSTTFNVDSFASYAKTSVNLAGAEFGSLSAESESYQVSSSAFWRPDEESPLSVTGNVRYFNASSASGANSATFDTLAGSLFANYQYSRNIGFSGGLSLNQVNTNGRSRLLTTQTASANYSGDTVEVWEGFYSYGAGTSLANQTGGEFGGQQNLNLSGSHSFSRELLREARSSVSFNVGQSVGMTVAGNNASSQNLSHRGSLNWDFRQSQNAVMRLNATVADTRTFGQRASDGQQLALSANGNLQLSRYSTFGANFFLQGTRINSPETIDHGFDWAASGGFNYSNGRAFGIPRLRYTAAFTANTLLRDSRVLGNIDANRDQATYSLDQRLDYRIGRLSLQGTFRLARQTNGNNAIVFVRINREFGAF